MAWTANNVTDFIRALVNESTASFWTTAQIALFEQAGMSKILSMYYPWLYTTHKTWGDFATTAGDPDATSMPSNLYKVAYLCVKETGKEIDYISTREIWKYYGYGAGNAMGWTWKANKINLIPAPSASDTDYLEIHYMPILDAVTEFPDCMRPLIAVEAVIFAKVKDEDVTADLFKMQKDFQDAVMSDLTLHYIEAVDVFPDYSLGESLA